MNEQNNYPDGLTSSEAKARLTQYGPNSLSPPKKAKGVILFFSQFKSPLILLLIATALLSFFLGDRTDATIISIIVYLSGLLGFFQERGALNSLEKLLQLVAVKSSVKRDGKEVEIPVEEVVPGDVVILNVGDIVPADCTILEVNRLFVDEATLTGESVPVEKDVSHQLFMGTVIASGKAVAEVTATGKKTKYGQTAETIRFRPPETAFEIGVRKFGFLLLLVTLILISSIFVFNIFIHRPLLQALLFSLALGVGLTPQLLPAIISVNLSHGARKMAQKQVIVKRLASIENFGQMNVLCADKTGTITEGKIHLDRAVTIDGQPSERVLLFGAVNGKFQTAYANPMDQAILEKTNIDMNGWNRIDEIPYDFNRKRLSVIFAGQAGDFLVSKGAVHQILDICTSMECPDGTIAPLDREQLEKYFEEQSNQGFRTLGVAYRDGREEKDLIFLGFLLFLDPLKPDIAKVVEEMKRKGVQLKIITGDTHAVAFHAASSVGMIRAHLATGAEVKAASDEALQKMVREKNVFAEIEPKEKERIIIALKKNGLVVGYLGDGVNDVAALHNADVGIAVDTGSDAAKAAADIVLLKKDLSVLKDGIVEGRATFANTMKYVYMATSANFGNMFSMAGASLFLSFLPMLPKQVLLTNLLTDFPEMAIATDRVDEVVVHKPMKWDLKFIRRFMIVFGLISSIFDYATFAVLLFVLKAEEKLFQTGWFVESVASAALIVLVIRTRGFAFRSAPSKLLAIAVFAVVIGVLFLPFTPLGTLFGFVPLPLIFYPPLFAILILYVLTVEVAKRFFFKH